MNMPTRKMRAKQIMEDWGVVQELIIEADTGIALRAACEIAFTEHPSGCSHYRIDGGQANGIQTEARKKDFVSRTRTDMYS